MPRLTIDTNGFQTISDLLTHTQRLNLAPRNWRDDLEVFLNLEALEESMGLHFDPAQLRVRAETILPFVSHRLLRSPEEIVRSELAGRVVVLEESASVAAIRAVLQQIVDGHVPRSVVEIAAGARERKQATVAYYRTLQEPIRALPDELRRSLADTTFPDFHGRYWTKQGHNYVCHVAAGLDGVDLPGLACEVMSKPQRFPFTTMLMTVISMLLYRYLVTNRSVKKGDAYDSRQLIYLAYLDGIVSDDRGLRDICNDLHGSSKATISVDGFLATYLL